MGSCGGISPWADVGACDGIDGSFGVGPKGTLAGFEAVGWVAGLSGLGSGSDGRAAGSVAGGGVASWSAGRSERLGFVDLAGKGSATGSSAMATRNVSAGFRTTLEFSVRASGAAGFGGGECRSGGDVAWTATFASSCGDRAWEEA